LDLHDLRSPGYLQDISRISPGYPDIQISTGHPDIQEIIEDIADKFEEHETRNAVRDYISYLPEHTLYNTI